MKIATILCGPSNEFFRFCFKLWVDAMLKQVSKDDIVLIVDEKAEYKDCWHNTVVGRTLQGFKILYDKQNLVYSDYLKAQGFNLLNEPVMVVDVDCILQGALPSYNDKKYRIGLHTPGTAPDIAKIHGKEATRVNCALQYQGFDILSDFDSRMAGALSDPAFAEDWCAGELVFSHIYNDYQESGKLVDLFPASYTWYAAIEPFPEDTVFLHYGCEMKDALQALMPKPQPLTPELKQMKTAFSESHRFANKAQTVIDEIMKFL